MSIVFFNTCKNPDMVDDHTIMLWQVLLPIAIILVLKGVYDDRKSSK
jgi:hypothetical protein